MAAQPQLACGLQKCLRNVPDLSAFSDFTVLVEGVSFPCHKVILNACSEYFQALFRSQMKECQESRIDLKGVTKDAFVVIFDSLYKGICGLTNENIIEVWQSTVLLHIGFMIDECERFVKETMTASNCLEFYNHANQLDSKNVKSFSSNFVCNNFELCMSDMWFNQLPAIDVYNILQNDHLKARCEDSVVKVIVNWINYTEKRSAASTEPRAGIASESIDDIVVNTATVDRKQHVVKLLSAVRLCLVSNECLKELFDDDIIMSCRAARDMIKRAVDYKLSVKHRHGPWPDTAVHRATSEMKHAMVFASGATVNVYLLKDGSTHAYTILPDAQLASLAVFDNVLYKDNWYSLQMCTDDKAWNTLQMYTQIAGWNGLQMYTDYEGLNGLQMYPDYEDWDNMQMYGPNAARNTLYGNQPCVSVPTRRNMLSHGSYIYCIDIRLGCLQRFNCTHGCPKIWVSCVPETNYLESIIAHRANILLFGTLNGEVRTLCFYPDLNKCKILSPSKPISGPLDGMVSFVYDENVFVLQKNGHLWKIVSDEDLEINFEFQCELWGFAWQIYGSIVYQKQLFIFGSINCEHKPTDFLWPTSLPGIIQKVRIVQIQSDTPCLPIILALNK